jgi:hypothetical protein
LRNIRIIVAPVILFADFVSGQKTKEVAALGSRISHLAAVSGKENGFGALSLTTMGRMGKLLTVQKWN